MADRKADADEAAEEAEATDGTALEYHAVASDNRDGELVLRRRWEVAAAAEEGRIMTVEDILSFCFFGCDGDGNDVVKECTTVSACNTPSTSRTRKTEADDDADDEPSIVDGDCFLLVVMVTINWLSMSPPRFFVNFPLALCLFPIREFFLLLLLLLLLLLFILNELYCMTLFVDV